PARAIGRGRLRAHSSRVNLRGRRTTAARYADTATTTSTNATKIPSHGTDSAAQMTMAAISVRMIVSAEKALDTFANHEWVIIPPVGARGTSCSAWHDQHLTFVSLSSALTRNTR